MFAVGCGCFPNLAASRGRRVWLGHRQVVLGKPGSELVELASYAGGKEARPTISDEEKRARDELKRLELAVREKSGGLMSAVEGAVEGVSVDTPLNILMPMGRCCKRSARRRRGSRPAG